MEILTGVIVLILFFCILYVIYTTTKDYVKLLINKEFFDPKQYEIQKLYTKLEIIYEAIEEHFEQKEEEPVLLLKKYNDIIYQLKILGENVDIYETTM